MSSNIQNICLSIYLYFQIVIIRIIIFFFLKVWFCTPSNLTFKHVNSTRGWLQIFPVIQLPGSSFVQFLGLFVLIIF